MQGARRERGRAANQGLLLQLEYKKLQQQEEKVTPVKWLFVSRFPNV